ncbi:hypothetical protein [Pedobacter aquatilis]|uniref:hypothetical protein n=1 Tax=Pedobacter aquatilis TaxID=351343 RepID=UPI00292DC96A|nr:hypothetical protein [Pedobacter aquatilis]
MQFLHVTGYAEAYHEPAPKYTLSFVAGYSTDTLLLRLSKINAMLFQQIDNRMIDPEILREAVFCDVPGFKQVTEFRPLFTDDKRWFAEGPIGLLIMDLLKNFRIIDTLAPIEPLEFARNLFKTILVYNDLYYGRPRGIVLESLEGIFMMEAMQQGYLRAKGVMKVDTFGRFLFLSKFIDSDGLLREEADMYCENMKIENPWTFAKFFLAVLASAVHPQNWGNHMLDLAHLWPEKLMREFGADPMELAGKEKLSLNMDVVTKPFLFLKPEKILVLDYNFFQYALENGFLYSLFRHSSKKLKAKFKTYENFKAYIALEFFEKYLVGNLLDKIFHKKSHQLISTEKYQDFIVRASSCDVFVFEVKMNDLHPNTFENLDYKAFTSEFLDKRFLSDKGTGAKDKGVSQIIRQLGYLSEPNSELRKKLGIKRSEKMNIYPVIICSEHHMNIAGVNHYLNEGFQQKSKHLKGSFQSIKPLTVIHIDFLIKYFGSLRRNPALFAEWLSGYHRSKKGLEKLYDEKGGPITYLLSKRSLFGYMEMKKNFPSPYKTTVAEIEKCFDLETKGVWRALGI